MEKNSSSNYFTWLLLATSLLCGSLIMVVEVLGSRVIGPFFGVSLFVWTSLITVTMIALAAGYAIGGVLSDRREHPDYLYGIILISGFLVALIPFLKSPVLKACSALGLRAGAFVSALILFGPCLLLLGCVSPYIIKIAAREMRSIGRTVGSFYAVSTVGSVFGTVLTGFVLVAFMDVDHIFFLVGALLALLASAYFVLLRRRWVLALAPVLLLLLLPRTPAAVSYRPDGTKVEVVAKKDGYYGNIKVVDYSYGAAHTRELIIDGLVQGGVEVATGRSVYPYSYILGSVPRHIRPGGKRCLVIGLGAGVIPRLYEAAGIPTDVVDIDPDVAATAGEYFGFARSGDVVIEDARYYLAQTDRTYDYIVLDVFNGDTTPAHLLSFEAFSLIRRCLSENGVLAVNYMGSLQRENFATASVIKTLEAVFPIVDLYPNFDPASAESYGNMSIFAYGGERVPARPEMLSGLDVHPFAQQELRSFAAWSYRFPESVEAVVLRDSFNPLDCLDLWLKEKVRQEIIATTNWDVLIM